MARAFAALSARSVGTRALVVFVAGLLAGLAFAPTYLIALWPLGFALTLGLLYGAQTWPMRLWLSFLFAYGSMVSSLYWIALAPTADPQFYWTIPFALLLLPAVAALFGTLALFLASFWRRDPLSFGLLASAAWLFFEWRRGLDLTGFAWNRTGMIWTADPLLMQAAALGGVALLSLVAVLVGVGFFWLLFGRTRLGLGLVLALPALLIGFGAVRLAQAPQSGLETIPGVKVRLVQANIPKNTWDSGFVFNEHVRHSTRRPLDGISHVIWPEGSIRDYIDLNPALAPTVANALQGAPYSLTFTRRAVDADMGRQAGTHLSAILLDHESLDYAAYDKSHLVPFGEYIPYSRFFGRLGFAAMTNLVGQRVPGGGPVTLQTGDGTKIGVFVCYDSIYSGQIIDQSNRPDWMVTLTEDAWYILPEVPIFAKTSGPYQHLAEARLRAVEEGLSLARASNPGISGVIDAFGRSWGPYLPLGQAGTLDSTIPKKIDRTPYSRLGPTICYGILILFCLKLGVVLHLFARLPAK